MSRRFIIFGGVLIFLLGSFLIDVDAKLLGYWTFDVKANAHRDSSPNSNHGDFKGGAGWTPKGKVAGGVILEEGADSYFEVPHDNSLNATDQVTLMCWVKFTRPDFGRDQSLVWKNAPFKDSNKRFWASYALRTFREGFKLGGFAFDANTEGGRTAAVDPDFLVANDWYHVAGVADGKEVRVYTNGKEKIVKEQRGAFRPTDFPLTIGHDLRDPDAGKVRRDQLGYVQGVMDEVVVLSHALTAAQVKEAKELGDRGKSLDKYAPVAAVEPTGKIAVKWGEIKARR